LSPAIARSAIAEWSSSGGRESCGASAGLHRAVVQCVGAGDSVGWKGDPGFRAARCTRATSSGGLSRRLRLRAAIAGWPSAVDQERCDASFALHREFVEPGIRRAEWKEPGW